MSFWPKTPNVKGNNGKRGGAGKEKQKEVKALLSSCPRRSLKLLVATQSAVGTFEKCKRTHKTTPDDASYFLVRISFPTR